MSGGFVEAAERFFARWRVLLTIASVVWFAVSCASYAGFVRLPVFELIVGLPGVLLAGLWNAVWWGWLYPRAEQRRVARQTATDRNDG